MAESKSRRVRRTDVWLTFLGIAGLVFFLSFYDQAFPAAALNLSRSRAEIAAAAQAYAADQGYDLQDYEFVLSFQQDSSASYYLQRILGIPETNRLIREETLPVWYWHARWFRPLQKEEFGVSLATDGRVIGFSHRILESDPGAARLQEQAHEMAETYLREDRGWDLADWEEISASSETRPGGRVDHTFTWRRRVWSVGESELRLSVTIQGGAVGYYDYWVKTPETFWRDFSQRYQVASFVSGASLFLGMVIIGGILVLAASQRGKLASLDFSFARFPALLVAGVALASGLNTLPLAKADYGTTTDYGLFWLQVGISVLAGPLLLGLFVYCLWGIAHWMGKRVWPRQDKILDRRGDRWQALAHSGWRGLILGGLEAGYVVLFYLIATKVFGGWAPMVPDYEDAFATPLPFLEALMVGLFPAMWEELVFRLLGIAAILWFTRTYLKLPEPFCRFLALLIPGALWACGHLTYIREPFYLRGIELTVAAVLLEGLFFMKFDLITTMVAHYAYNAGLTALPLLRSNDPGFVAAGLVVLATMAAPVVPGLLRAWLRKGKAAEVPQIREAAPEDLEALCALPVEDAEWETWMADTSAVILCLWTGETLIGVAAAKVDEQKVATMMALYVAPAWRRQYWGSALVERLCGALEALGVESLHTEIAAKDDLAHGFWGDQGAAAVRITLGRPVKPEPLPGLPELLASVRTRLHQDRPSRALPPEEPSEDTPSEEA